MLATRNLVFGLIVLVMPVMAAETGLNTEHDKTVYAIGLTVGQSLGGFQLSEQELELLKAGLTDGVLGREAKLDPQQYRAQIQALQRDRAQAAAEVERGAAEKYLASMASQEGAEQMASGLIYFELEEGEGASPAATDTVSVHYHGTLRDGTVFDSSVDRGQPATFPLNGVIPCWTEAVQKMKVGGKSRLVCPASIAYGDRGAGPLIKPGAALVFEVELLGIE